MLLSDGGLSVPESRCGDLALDHARSVTPERLGCDYWREVLKLCQEWCGESSGCGARIWCRTVHIGTHVYRTVSSTTEAVLSSVVEGDRVGRESQMPYMTIKLKVLNHTMLRWGP